MTEPGREIEVGLATHELVWVEGSDAITFLDSQVSQDVMGMAPGTVRRSLLLEPRGKLRAILWVLRDAERVGLVVAARVHPT
jgi:folate-binding Fe-S cluster repair protein YgfZ